MGILAVMQDDLHRSDITHSGAGLPWLMLVKPGTAWRLLSTVGTTEAWGYALFAQWLLLGLAQVVAIKPSFELAQYAGLTARQLPPSWLAVAWQLLLYALGISLGNAFLAWLIWLIARLTSQRLAYRSCFTLTSFSLLPVVVGSCLGTLVFALVQPLTRSPAHALGMLIRPFSFSLASLPPLVNDPLALGWVFASYLDVFSIWSLALFAMGSMALLRQPPKQTAWLVLGVVLLLAAGLSAWWRILQAVTMH